MCFCFWSQPKQQISLNLCRFVIIVKNISPYNTTWRDNKHYWWNFCWLGVVYMVCVMLCYISDNFTHTTVVICAIYSCRDYFQLIELTIFMKIYNGDLDQHIPMTNKVQRLCLILTFLHLFVHIIAILYVWFM